MVENLLRWVGTGIPTFDSEKNLEKFSKEALEQIINKKYNIELIKKGIKDITYIGIAFYKKQLRISYK